MPKVCALCATPYQGRASSRYCSDACRAQAWGRAKVGVRRTPHKRQPITNYGKYPKPLNHGKRYSYDLGCRCEPCVDAARAWWRSKPPKGGHRHRARKYGVPYEPVTLTDIYSRDNWVCQLCGDPVDSSLTFPDQMSATLDHITPMSLGGPHSPANLQLAHWLCNILKGADPHMTFKVSQ